MVVVKSKVVVITGSTRGFGYAVAEAMLRAGAHVVISGRSQDALDRALASLGRLGSAAGLVCDVRQAEQVYALARFAVETFGGIQVWINNAGLASPAGRMIDIPPEQALDLFMANDMGTLYGAQAALHFMLPSREGVLVNIYGHGSYLRPAWPTGLYGATKAWVTSFTRTLAVELNGSGLQLIGFNPGMLLTDMLLAPSAAGAQGVAMMKNYGFVLRVLARPPEWAAAKLVRAVEHAARPFEEHSLTRPWTFLIGLLRATWENLTGHAQTPVFELHVVESHQPKI